MAHTSSRSTITTQSGRRYHEFSLFARYCFERETTFATVCIYWEPSAALVRNVHGCGVCGTAAFDVFRF